MRFEEKVRRVANIITEMLIEKNTSYGDAALNPMRIFSKADRYEQLLIRIDDKLSRIAKGNDYKNEDTINDLIGYLILLKIQMEDKVKNISPNEFAIFEDNNFDSRIN